MKDTIPAGTYIIFNALSYTSQLLTVTAAGAEVYTAPSAHYPASLLGSASLSDVAAILGHERTVVYVFVAAPVPVVGQGRARGHAMHIELATLGYGRGFECASAALGRTVTSLASISEAERGQVLNFAYGQWGRTYSTGAVA